MRKVNVYLDIVHKENVVSCTAINVGFCIILSEDQALPLAFLSGDSSQAHDQSPAGKVSTLRV